MKQAPHSPENRPEDDPFAPGDELWEALGQAPKSEPDAWLATKTMARWRREQEKQEEPVSLWAAWLRPLSLARMALAGGAVAAIGLAITLSLGTVSGPEEVTLAQRDATELAPPTHPVEALLAADENLEVFAAFPAPVESVEPREAPTSGAPLEEALAYLADGQSGDVLFAEADWQSWQ